MSRPADSPEIARWRADTPGSERVIHLNNAGAALQPAAVRDAVLRHLELEQEMGGYEAAEARMDAIRDAYEAVGRLIGASERNVAMQQNSTVAFAQAFAAFDLFAFAAKSENELDDHQRHDRQRKRRADQDE